MRNVARNAALNFFNQDGCLKAPSKTQSKDTTKTEQKEDLKKEESPASEQNLDTATCANITELFSELDYLLIDDPTLAEVNKLAENA